MSTSERMPAAVAERLDSEFGLSGSFAPLPGENQNYLLTTAERSVVVKLVGDDVDAATLDLQRTMAAHVQAATIDLRVPRDIAPKQHSDSPPAPADTYRLRVLEFVSGTPWCASVPRDESSFRELGRMLGELSGALANFSHPAADRTHTWDLTQANQHREHIRNIDSARRRRCAERAFHMYAACALPRLASLPRSVIHGDVNDENVLMQDGRISGLLDFGDCLEAPTVCELAIALAYAMLDVPEPLRCGALVVGAYQEKRRLSADEQEVLLPLVWGRLATSVTIAARRRAIDPTRENWFVTEERAWRLLELLDDMDPRAAAARLLEHVSPLSSGSENSAATLLERRRKHIGTSLSIAYREPLEIVRGRGPYLDDARGRPYLDLVNNVCHVGHCHPRVVAAGQRQMGRLNTNTRYLFDGLMAYAERLSATLPAPLDTCFFVNSGSEANELALRLAATHTGRDGVLVVDGAYHGHTSALIGMSPYKFGGPGGRGKPDPGVHVVPVPDPYRGVHKGRAQSTGVAYGDDVKQSLESADRPIAAFLVESHLSCAGQIILPPAYLKTAFGHVRDAGGLCISDEVQVGFGRVGTHFWAFESQEVVPDIVVMGKPIGNGHPMAAVVTTAEIAASFANGMEFFATFGGNPVSCAIGLAVLDVIEDEALQQRALQLGERFLGGLHELRERHALVGDVRGAGLFLGIELVRDRTTLEPAAAEAQELVERMKTRGVLLSTDGPLHNVIKIKPPMVLAAEDIDMALRGLDDELAAIGGALP